MMWTFLIALAIAADPDPDRPPAEAGQEASEPPVLELPPIDEEVFQLPEVEPLPSVVESVLDVEQRTLVRWRFAFRPVLSVVIASEPDPDAVGARLGGTFVHRWWTIPRKGLTWSGETSLTADGVVGSVRGWETELSSVVGPWLGPVSLRLGPVLRGSSLGVLGAMDRLPEAFLMGFRGAATLDTRFLTVQAAATPVWRVAGERDPGPLPGVTELEVGGALAGRFVLLQVIRMQAGLGTRARFTSIGPITDVFLVLNISVGPPE